MSITVIIVACNSSAIIRGALDSVCADALVQQCIVVDNASQDDTCALIRAEYPDVTVIENPHNIGFGRACNQALAQVDTPYALLLNPDARLGEGALLQLHDVLEQSPRAAIAAPVFGGEGASMAESLRLPECVSAAASLLRPTLLDGVYSASFINGAIALCHMAHMREVGFFDEAFFLFYEDDDISLRVTASGYELLLVQHIDANHKAGHSVPAGNAVSHVKLTCLQWSRLYLHCKHRGVMAAWRLWWQDYLQHRTQRRQLASLPRPDLSLLQQASLDVERQLAHHVREVELALFRRITAIYDDTHARHLRASERLHEVETRERDAMWQRQHQVIERLIDDVAVAYDGFLATLTSGRASSWKKQADALHSDMQRWIADWRGLSAQKAADYATLQALREGGATAWQLSKISGFHACDTLFAELESVLAMVTPAVEAPYTQHAYWQDVADGLQQAWQAVHSYYYHARAEAVSQHHDFWARLREREREFWQEIFAWPRRVVDDKVAAHLAMLRQAESSPAYDEAAVAQLNATLQTLRAEAYRDLESVNDRGLARLQRLHELWQQRHRLDMQRDARLQLAAQQQADAQKDRLWARYYDEINGLWAYTRRHQEAELMVRATRDGLRLFRQNPRHCSPLDAVTTSNRQSLST